MTCAPRGIVESTGIHSRVLPPRAPTLLPEGPTDLSHSLECGDEKPVQC
jgi:hypothetical protein